MRWYLDHNTPITSPGGLGGPSSVPAPAAASVRGFMSLASAAGLPDASSAPVFGFEARFDEDSLVGFSAGSDVSTAAGRAALSFAPGLPAPAAGRAAGLSGAVL